MLAAGALGERGDQKQISRLVTFSTILEMESFLSQSAACCVNSFVALLLEGEDRAEGGARGNCPHPRI
jgi:hypothetical protein